MKNIRICGYEPGAIGRIVELHANYYSKHSNFGLFFEAKVATDVSEFLSRFDKTRDGFWIAKDRENIIGAVAINGVKADKEGAHLRWFIVDPKYHGKGIGDTLLRNAVDFCKKAKFKKVYLWTFSGLDAARHLY
ncbi:MAG: GNAT family N-acetyltransferase, partial [Nanoarchaeota archaeon]